jgi:hypothetical protein
MYFDSMLSSNSIPFSPKLPVQGVRDVSLPLDLEKRANVYFEHAICLGFIMQYLSLISPGCSFTVAKALCMSIPVREVRGINPTSKAGIAIESSIVGVGQMDLKRNDINIGYTRRDISMHNDRKPRASRLSTRHTPHKKQSTDTVQK